MSGPIFGLTSNGLAIMRQSDIISAFQAQLQAALGQNINVLPQSILGQITNIVAEREALVWELLEAVYNSQYPATAEGTSLDNILALTGLKRLPATPSYRPVHWCRSSGLPPHNSRPSPMLQSRRPYPAFKPSASPRSPLRGTLL
jgi:hypothetical protein